MLARPVTVLMPVSAQGGQFRETGRGCQRFRAARGIAVHGAVAGADPQESD